MINNNITWGVTYPEDLAFNTGVPKLYINKLNTVDDAYTKAITLEGQGYIPEDLRITKHIGYKITQQISLVDIQHYDIEPYDHRLEEIFEDNNQTIQ